MQSSRDADVDIDDVKFKKNEKENFPGVEAIVK